MLFFSWSIPMCSYCVGTCPVGQYSTFADNINTCRPHTACVVGQTFQTTAATNTADRVCGPATVCVNNMQWQRTAPTRYVQFRT